MDIDMRQGCIMSSWPFILHMATTMKGVKMGMERRGESGDYLSSCMQVNLFCGEMEEELKVMLE